MIVSTTDIRMLAFMEYCIDTQVSGITMIKDWCAFIGIHPNNIAQIKSGSRSFTVEQLNAAGLLGASMDYLFGFSDDMLRSKKKLSAMQLLKAAVRGVESELQETKLKQNLKQSTKKR